MSREHLWVMFDLYIEKQNTTIILMGCTIAETAHITHLLSLAKKMSREHLRVIDLKTKHQKCHVSTYGLCLTCRLKNKTPLLSS